MRGGVPEGARDRRPGAARAAARDLHRRGRRHGGAAVSAPTHRQRWTEAADGQLRRAAARPWSAATARTVWDDDGSALPRPGRRHRGQRARPRPPGGRRGGDRGRSRPSGTRRTCSPTEPSVRLAERLLALTGRDGRVFFANSGAEANEAAFKMARRTGRAGGRRRRGRLPRPHHGRARADRPAGQAGAVRAAARAASPSCRTATPAALPPRSATDTAAVVPRADPGRGRRRPPPAGYLAAARARHPRGTARCWCSTRCRPASAAPARGSPTSRRASSPTS